LNARGMVERGIVITGEGRPQNQTQLVNQLPGNRSLGAEGSFPFLRRSWRAEQGEEEVWVHLLK